jgi:hypothetical protein
MPEATYSDAEPAYRITQGTYGQWFIQNWRDPELGWSGSHWVDQQNGVPGPRGHLINFASEDEARKYAEDVWGV